MSRTLENACQPTSAPVAAGRPWALPRLARLCTLALLLGLPMSGCNKDVGSPEATAERFFAAIRNHDHAAVWAGITEQSQASLKARHAALTQVTGDDADPTAIVKALGLTALSEAKAPIVVSPLGDRVTVRFSGPRGSTDLHLVRVGPDWKVDLARSLASLPNEDA